MKSVNELLKLFMRQAELESAMRQPCGAPCGDVLAATADGRPS
jgi:hypothetical protein